MAERKYAQVGVSIRKDILEKIDERCLDGMIPRSRLIEKALEKEFGGVHG